MIVWITIYLLLIKCGANVLISKYGICDINTVVNIKLSFPIAEMSHGWVGKGTGSVMLYQTDPPILYSATYALPPVSTYGNPTYMAMLEAV